MSLANDINYFLITIFSCQLFFHATLEQITSGPRFRLRRIPPQENSLEFKTAHHNGNNTHVKPIPYRLQQSASEISHVKSVLCLF